MKLRKFSRKRRAKKERPDFEPNSAGIDVSPYCMYVAVSPDRDDDPVRRFGTFTRDLKAIAAWLKQGGVRVVAMESTGVYWIPLYQILVDRGFKVLLVNASHFKNVPGRKSDVSDCEWLQYLLSVGLLRGSFRPSQEICAIRALARHREALLVQAVRQVQWIQKSMDEMNLHLHHVIDDLMGKTGRLILEAILAGERNPRRLAQLRDPRIKASSQTIVRALEGDYREENLFIVRQSYETWQRLMSQIRQCDQEMERLTASLEKQPAATPYEGPTKRNDTKNRLEGDWHRLLFESFRVDLTRIPGIQVNTAFAVLTEVGTDFTAFPSAEHFSSWLTLCPHNDTSGEKVLKRRTRRGQQRLRKQLIMAAFSLYRSQTALGAKFRRMRTRLGAPKAITAMAHLLARIIWKLVTSGLAYDDSIFVKNEKNYQKRRRNWILSQARQIGLELVDSTMLKASP